MADSMTEVRKRRRKIIELLRAQQVEDSCCAEKLTRLGLEAKRRLLWSLATWFVSFEPGGESSAEDRAALAEAHISLDDWLAVQCKVAELSQRLDLTKARENQAHNLYRSVAPLGRVQVALKNGPQKAKAQKLQEEYWVAKSAREDAERHLNGAQSEIRTTVASFLDSAIRPEFLGILAMRSSLRSEMLTMFQEFDRRAREVWEPHARSQESSLEHAWEECRSLLNFYRGKAPGYGDSSNGPTSGGDGAI